MNYPVSNGDYPESTNEYYYPEVVSDPAPMMNYPESINYPLSNPEPGASGISFDSVVQQLNRAVLTKNISPAQYAALYNQYPSAPMEFPSPEQYAGSFVQTSGYSTTGISTAPLDASAQGQYLQIVQQLNDAVLHHTLTAEQYAALYSMYPYAEQEFPSPTQYAGSFETTPSAGTAKGLGITAALLGLLTLFRK